MSEYAIAIPSRNRAEKVTTLQAFEGLDIDRYIFVNDEKEKEEYEKHNKGVKVISCFTSGITNVRNFMLDYFSEGKKIVTLCDDVDGVYKAVEGKLVKLTPQELHALIIEGFRLAELNKTKLWGVYPVSNAFYMDDKFSPDGFVIGTFSGIIVSDIRHDSQMILKEDYDFTIKHVQKFKRIVRFNNYCVKAKHYSNKGGCVDYRTTEAEQKSIARLKEMYPEIIKDNPRRPNEILLKWQVKSPSVITQAVKEWW